MIHDLINSFLGQPWSVMVNELRDALHGNTPPRQALIKTLYDLRPLADNWHEMTSYGFRIDPQGVLHAAELVPPSHDERSEVTEEPPSVATTPESCHA